ncbi:MAG: drug/metabolite transporter (DMT)-like permease [Ilumatobacter sp.]|jgi:drug/metabolite transporter (DMT)-like permease
MTIGSFFLVLSAAVLHATWNLVVKQSADRLVSTWAIVTSGAMLSVPVSIFIGLPERAALPWLATSALLHVAYGYALAGAYDRIDLAAAYPIARGTAPLIVMVGSIMLLDDVVSPVGFIGIALVVASLGLIGIRHVPNGVGWALLTGLMIALYTLSDGAGVRAGNDSIRYIAALFQLHALAFGIMILATRRSPTTMIAAVRRSPLKLLFGGAASAGAYLLVMIAARTTPLGLVAGLRETSAGFGVVAGALVLKERVTRQHAVAVAVAVIGGGLIALS